MSKIKYEIKEIAALPEVLTLEHIRKFCHIGASAARYYVKSGLLPCAFTGKKTKCYRIRKTDLLAFLQRYESHPEQYIIPQEWIQYRKIHRARFHSVISLSPPDMLSPVVREYFAHKTEPFPDLIVVRQVVVLTGYNAQTIARWVRLGKLQAFCREPKIWLQKEVVVDFLASNVYNDIPVKSKTHLDDIQTIYKQIHN